MAASVVLTTFWPLTTATTLVVVASTEKAWIEKVSAFGAAPALVPALTPLYVPEDTSFDSAVPIGSRKYCHL